MARWKEIPCYKPFLGLYLDPPRSEIPYGKIGAGFAKLQNFHLNDDKLDKYRGWAPFLFGGDPVTTEGNINFGIDFVTKERDRQFIFAEPGNIWHLNRDTNTKDLVGSGFTGDDVDRWQSMEMNGRLILTNGRDTPQLLSEDGGSVQDLSADAFMPTRAKYCLNCMNHAVFGNILEGTLMPGRVRWSDIDDYTTWTPGDDVEGSHLDVDYGEIRNMGTLGPRQFIVYTGTDAYTYTYVGSPTFFDKSKTLNGIGLFAPYSLVVIEDRHYGLGSQGFFMFNGIGSPQRIGRGRVDTFIFQSIRQNSPEDMYGYAHPIFPEIWWVYKSKTADFFDSVLVYNWEKDCWASRAYFPHSFMATYLQTQGQAWSDATNTWREATVTWKEKRGEGVQLVLGGKNQIHLHGYEKTGYTVPLEGIIESGDLFGRNQTLHVSRVWYDIQSAGGVVWSEVGVKLAPGESIEYEPLFQLDDDMRHDIRLTGKVFGFRLSTLDLMTLSDFSALVQPGGDRP